MDLQIVIRNVQRQDNLREFAAAKLSRALERFEDRVLSATMRLEDVTGPAKQTENNIRCAIDLHLRTGDLHISEQGDDFEPVICTAVDRLKAALSREVSRHKRGIGEG
jgi:ribosomal subunit interface protein